MDGRWKTFFETSLNASILSYYGRDSDDIFFLFECLLPSGHSFGRWAETRITMAQPPSDPPVADQAPDADVLTTYDREHLATYLRLLDADSEGADWGEVARIVLNIDPAREPERARRAWESHLARAKWMTEHGYQHLIQGGAPH
jgi:T6SS, Transcription factor, DNA binding domain